MRAFILLYISINAFLNCGDLLRAQRHPNEGNLDKVLHNKEYEFTTPEIEHTDMPEDLGLSALNLDFGTYESPAFHYVNHQDFYITPAPPDMDFPSNCMEQYMRCLLDQSVPEPICAFNSPYKDTVRGFSGYLSAYSYCDVYFDNCRRGYRVWRTIDVGVCRFGYGDWRDDVMETRRAKLRNKLIEKIHKSMPDHREPITNDRQNMYRRHG